MAVKSSFQPIDMQSFDSSTMLGTFQSMDANGLSGDAAVFKMYNASEEDAIVSFDGVTDHDIVPANGTFILDCGVYADGRRPAVAKGTQIYLRGTPDTGFIYVSGYTQMRG